eukprot:3432792-Prymnesium_polylepis.1
MCCVHTAERLRAQLCESDLALSIYDKTYFNPLPFPGDRREVASERIQRSCAGITPTRVAAALRGPRGVC